MDLRLLGTVELSTDGRALGLGGPKARALLADLALNVGRALRTDANGDGQVSWPAICGATCCRRPRFKP